MHIYNDLAGGRSSGVTSPMTSLSSSHVTSTVGVVQGVLQQPVSSADDMSASLFIGALLFIPVTLILCVTGLIRLRNSGTLIHRVANKKPRCR